MLRLAGHGALAVVLSALSLSGGLAWLLSRLLPRRRWLGFLGIYALLWGALWLVAPLAGRVALPCLPGQVLHSQSLLYCALNRHYVTPELRDLAQDLAEGLARDFPGTELLTLDAGFPLTGLPLLPHLSHHDGEKLDLALFYRDAQGRYLPGRTRSVLGYFAFEPGPDACAGRAGPLRWDLAALQPLWPDWSVDAPRLRALMRRLLADPRLGKLFLEPHLAHRLGVSGGKLRFQGCNAARHDDHIHLQL